MNGLPTDSSSVSFQETLEERDGLTFRALQGEALSPQEQARLAELNEWLESMEPPREHLPPDVLALIDEVLGRR